MAFNRPLRVDELIMLYNMYNRLSYTYYPFAPEGFNIGNVYAKRCLEIVRRALDRRGIVM